MSTQNEASYAEVAADSPTEDAEVHLDLPARMEALAEAIKQLADEAERMGDDSASRNRRLANRNAIKEKQELFEHCQLAYAARQQAVVYLNTPRDMSLMSTPALPAPSTSSTASSSQKLAVPRNIPKFRCGNETIQDPEAFLQRFRQVLSAHGLDLDQHARRILVLSLSRENATWVENSIPPNLSWSEIQEAFMRQYGDPERLSRHLRSFFHLQMRASEYVSEYAQRFEEQRLLANVDEDDRHAIKTFRNGLTDDLRALVGLAIKQLHEPVTTVSQVIAVASSIDWKPKSRKTPEETRSSENAGTDARANPGSHRYCQVHGEGTHTTARCFTLRARNKNRTNTADEEPAVALNTSQPANSQPQTGKIICYRCRNEGHYANECPRYDAPSSRDKPVVKLVTTVVAAKDARPPPLLLPVDEDPFLFSVLLNGQRHIAQLDCAASRSLISAKLAAQLGTTIEPQDGHLQFASPDASEPRVGITSPFHIRVGPWDAYYSCEVIPRLTNAQFLLGGDLIAHVGLGYFASLSRKPNAKIHDTCPVAVSTPMLAPDRLSSHHPPLELERESARANRAVGQTNARTQRQIDAPIIKKFLTVDPQHQQHPQHQEPLPGRRADIILQHHLRGHFGADALIDAIREAGYDWPSLAAEVRGACSLCMHCLRHANHRRGHRSTSGKHPPDTSSYGRG
jgi:hypothetical protein